MASFLIKSLHQYFVCKLISTTILQQLMASQQPQQEQTIILALDISTIYIRCYKTKYALNNLSTKSILLYCRSNGYYRRSSQSQQKAFDNTPIFHLRLILAFISNIGYYNLIQSKLNRYLLNFCINLVQISYIYITIITYNQSYMQSEFSQIRLPSIVAYNIEQLQNNLEVCYYFTTFTTQSNISYILQASLTKPTSLPVCLISSCNFKTIQQKISKENKKQVLSKYTVCTCDQINQVLQKYFIINISLQGFNGLQFKLVAFKHGIGQNCKLVQVGKFQQIVLQFQQQSKQIWNTYKNKYCRSMIDKKKQNIQLSYSVQPFLQFQVSTFLTPQFEAQIPRGVKQFEGYKKSYQFIFPISPITNIKEIQLKLLQFLNEKIILNSTQKQNLIKSAILNSPRASPRKIFNPHVFAKYAKQEKFQLFMVKGIYEYFHYGDQGFNDNGWGCAYRAMQTLVSWLNLQGYTEPMSEMFSIVDIQQKIDRFDRSRKLKGSNSWIGATEISWIVPTITTSQINCKILHVSDGKRILQKCQEFKNHFLTSGCPIMYGGGQYAYSIVGMHYNWKLGQCQFLILDPHYTGQDDYGKILQKKGLVWRKPDQMFKKGVFYNFCLPIIK